MNSFTHKSFNAFTIISNFIYISNFISLRTIVKRINSSENFDLIETLCNKILSEIMEIYSPLKSTVRVRKYKLPIDIKLSCVEVEMTRENNV